MSLFNAPARPLGPPPEHYLPQPGCIVYSDDGRRIWCTQGRLVIQYQNAVHAHEIPLALIDWNLNDPRDGWAYLEILTDMDGIATSIAPGAAATYPGTVRARPPETNSAADAGQEGAYYLPLARLAKGNITPFLAGQTCLYLYLDVEGVTEMFIDDSLNLWTFTGGKATEFLAP